MSEDLTKRSKICSSLEEKREGLFPQPGEKTSKVMPKKSIILDFIKAFDCV